MRRVALLMLVVLVAPTLASAAPAKGGQPASFKSLLSGKVVPLSLKLKELNNTWRRFTLVETGGMGAIFGPVATVGGAYYTKGDTVTVAGETFLLAYRQQGAQISLYQMVASGPGGAQMEELTAESPVTLSLLSLRNLAGMNDIRPFDLQQELAEYKKASEQAAQTASQMGGGESNNLQQLALAVQMYISDYDALPPLGDAETAAQALMEYVSDDTVFTDPSTGDAYAVNSSLSGKSLSEIDDPAQAVVFYQAEPGNDGKRGVAFLDGHVQRVSDSQWEELRASSGIQ